MRLYRIDDEDRKFFNTNYAVQNNDYFLALSGCEIGQFDDLLDSIRYDYDSIETRDKLIEVLSDVVFNEAAPFRTIIGKDVSDYLDKDFPETFLDESEN